MFPSVGDMNYHELSLELMDMESTLQFLQKHGLIYLARQCPACGRNMNKQKQLSNAIGYCWVCPNRSCRKKCSLKTDTFFAGNLTPRQVLEIVYLWSYDMHSCKVLSREVRIASEAITNWCSYCRDICAEYFLRHPMQLGGNGRVVEIDESAFVRRKSNVDHSVKTQWVFGGLEVDTRKCFLVAVEERSADTLLQIIQQYVIPGSTIVSDCWRTYDTLNNHGYQHLEVNDRYNFVDPSFTGDTTKTSHIKSMWHRVKERNKRQHGTAKSYLDSYLIEFMWRQVFPENQFEHMLNCIRKVYPCGVDSSDNTNMAACID